MASPQTTFNVQVSIREMAVVRRHEQQILAALGQALPFPSPTVVIVRPGPTTTLIGFGGDLPRVPDSAEVDGAITGVLCGLATALHLTPQYPQTLQALDLRWPAHV